MSSPVPAWQSPDVVSLSVLELRIASFKEHLQSPLGLPAVVVTRMSAAVAGPARTPSAKASAGSSAKRVPVAKAHSRACADIAVVLLIFFPSKV